MEERIEELMMDYLSGTLSEEDQLEWALLVKDGQISESVIEEYKLLFAGLDQVGVREPSTQLSENFYSMLNEKIAKFTRYTILDQFAAFLYQKGLSRGGIQAAYSLMVLLLGLGVGYIFVGSADRSEISSLSGEVKEMKSMMMLSLLEKESPSARIKAVGLAQQMTDLDNEIVEALFTTLNSDNNTNVRLQALDALVKYTAKPVVRSGLIKSLNNQSSPLVQLALADIMVLLQDREGKSALEKLIEGSEMPEDVKVLMEERLKSINI